MNRQRRDRISDPGESPGNSRSSFWPKPDVLPILASNDAIAVMRKAQSRGLLDHLVGADK